MHGPMNIELNIVTFSDFLQDKMWFQAKAWNRRLPSQCLVTE